MDNIKPIEKTTGEALVIRDALHGMYERGNDSQCVMVMAGESVCFNFSLDLKQGLKFTLEQWNQIVEFVDSQVLGESDKQPSWAPDWSEIDEKYKYYAIDSDGKGFVYVDKPTLSDRFDEWRSNSQHNFIGYNRQATCHWADTFCIRPGVSLK